MPSPRRLETLPPLIARKLYKTGQTRGATTREIYQNRVSRNSTVLIPFDSFDLCQFPDDGSSGYENGFIVLVDPAWYFNGDKAEQELSRRGLILGENALLLFQRRADWVAHAPTASGVLPNRLPFTAADSRQAPLGGTYISRIHSTTATTDSGAIVRGFNHTKSRGAGIRVYEYASTDSLEQTRLQLEALFWLCYDAQTVAESLGMSAAGAKQRQRVKLEEAAAASLLDLERLEAVRMVDDERFTVCPLCLERLSATEFAMRGAQAEGRETWDITITEVSLFHIQELRVGRLQHKPYNLGWGHHYCNVVVKDAGIIPTLKWMRRVLDNNETADDAIDREAKLVEEAVEDRH